MSTYAIVFADGTSVRERFASRGRAYTYGHAAAVVRSTRLDRVVEIVPDGELFA